MTRRIDRELAERILAGNTEAPATALFGKRLNAFVAARSALRRLGVQVPARKGTNHCSIIGPNQCNVKIHVNVHSDIVRMPPTEAEKRAREGLVAVLVRRSDETTILTTIMPEGFHHNWSTTRAAATHLAGRCGGSSKMVARVCAAIERARARCHALIQEELDR